ncbi:MAG: hypothetical protein H7256_05040 [Bdellovibrio sp.]|nr:hypothetical protein [Bdellovibrio sp.]
MARSIIFLTFLSTLLISVAGLAGTTVLRWTGADDLRADFLHVVEVINQKSGTKLSASDFFLIEDRDLANNHFQMYVQSVNGLPVSQKTIRLWTNLNTGALIQAESALEGDAHLALLKKKAQIFSAKNIELSSTFLQNKVMALAKAIVRQHPDDRAMTEIKSVDQWSNGNLVRNLRIKGKHGLHLIEIDLNLMKVISATYESFPTADTSKPFAKDAQDNENEFSLPALVYPMYEETEQAVRQTRVSSQLKHLSKKVYSSTTDPYLKLRERTYLDVKQDSILGLTLEGQAQGYWAMSDIKVKAAQIKSQLTLQDNSLSSVSPTGHVILEGRYATVSLHPDAVTAFHGLNFTPARSTAFRPNWAPVSFDSDQWQMIPGGSYLGRPLLTYDAAYLRTARRLADHNPTEYINDGFDEVQVYHSINTLFESLHAIGFTDPELSTRPFHAFLYDPDISSRDNAYYTDDTINFTTYSSNAQNYARDNSTIWHELGHGIMDRLMGDSLQLADTGGLSEGMADFVAALVIEKVTNGVPFDGANDFRIINNTGFYLTNEVHDDGEAYGGAMKDLLVAARARWGDQGVLKVGDLTMETMRLCRNHPGLTAELWFSHMLFADQLGHDGVRAPNEMNDLILNSLAGRNFTFENQKRAEFKISANGSEVLSRGPGSRNNPIPFAAAPTEFASFDLQVTATDGDLYKIKYPVTVKVQYENGPLQGAMHWKYQEQSPVSYQLNSAEDVLNLNIQASGTCDFVNRADGSCQDFVYVQLWPTDATKPVAKKRFYLRLLPATKK